MMRLISGLLLSLILAGTSVTAAVRHSQMQGARLLVICSDSGAGSGTATVTLDASGNPIAPMHPCTVCLAACGLALLAGFEPLAAPLVRGQPLQRPDITDVASLPSPRPAARGPPTLA